MEHHLVSVQRSPSSDDRQVVVGAGLTGALLAARLAERTDEGSVLLIDRRPDLRVRDVDQGRSINLAISTRGLAALDSIGLADVVRDMAVPMAGRLMHDQTGELTHQPYGTEPAHVLHSVNRDALNAALLDAAEARPNVEIAFSTRGARRESGEQTSAGRRGWRSVPPRLQCRLWR